VPYRENTIEADEEEREPTWEEIIADDVSIFIVHSFIV